MRNDTGGFYSKTINDIVDSLWSFWELTSVDVRWLEVHAYRVRANIGLMYVDCHATTIGHRKAELIDEESDLER